MHEDERRRRAARKDFIRTHHPDRGGDITEFVIGLAQFDRESPETAASAHLRIIFVPHTSWPGGYCVPCSAHFTAACRCAIANR